MKKRFIITLLIIEIILINLFIPQNSYATTTSDEDVFDNDKNMPILAKPIGQLLCFIPDAILDQCQKLFVNTEPIKRPNEEVNQEKETKGKDEKINYYSIKYSPAIIFSGKVPAFDVNFINPNQGNTSTDGVKSYILENEGQYRMTNGVDENEYNQILNNIKNQHNDGELTNREYMFNGDYRTTLKYDIYYHLDNKATEDENDDVLVIETIGAYGTKVGDDIVRRSYGYGRQEVPTKGGTINGAIRSYESIAQKLQKIIATWYNALRRIALVGLLSALVYIGIRMVISSASKDKAKYKRMLKDWFVALCILFTLHYIMSITVTIVENINEVLKASSIGVEGEDIMLTTIRNDIANAKSWGSVLVPTVIYCIVAVQTIIFTIQYLKRTIYIAFLTMIAPLITLTYPLDKIKDSQSQAFDMWIKDYVFFMLLQIVHLLLYYILIGNSMDLSENGNWIFAIVAIGCLIPAEKIIKKMFGFNKSKTMGALAAGTTGAFIMNAINKIGGKGESKKKSPQASSGEETKTNVRTVSNDALNNATASLRGENPDNGQGEPNSSNDLKPNIINGAFSLMGKYGGSAVKTVSKASVAIPMAAFGFAAGAAEGNFGGAVKGALAGGAAGGALGGRIGNGIVDGIIGGGYLDSATKAIDNVKDVWNSGAYGDQFAKNASEARYFKRKEDYQELKEKYGDNLTDEKIRTMIQAGIKDKKNMDKVLGSSNMNEAIGYYTIAQKCPDEIYFDDKKLQMYLEDVVEDLGLTKKDIKTMKQNIKQFR